MRSSKRLVKTKLLGLQLAMVNPIFMRVEAIRQSVQDSRMKFKTSNQSFQELKPSTPHQMETRNVTLTLQKAKEFYNSGNAALKEVALQAFTKEELTTPKYTDIKTFEDACKALGMDIDMVEWDIEHLARIEGNLGGHLIAIYKLDIIRKALNGADWKPKMAKGDIYYGWVRFYKKSSNATSDKKIIGNFIADGQKYLLVGGFGDFGACAGLGGFGSGYGCGDSYANLGLLCCKSAEIAQYMSEQFGKIIFDACYAHHVGSYKWL